MEGLHVSRFKIPSRFLLVPKNILLAATRWSTFFSFLWFVNCSGRWPPRQTFCSQKHSLNTATVIWNMSKGVNLWGGFIRIARCPLHDKVVVVPTILLKQILWRDQGGDCCHLKCSFHSCNCADYVHHRTQRSQAHCKPNKEVAKEGEADKSWHPMYYNWALLDMSFCQAEGAQLGARMLLAHCILTESWQECGATVFCIQHTIPHAWFSKVKFLLRYQESNETQATKDCARTKKKKKSYNKLAL